MIVRRSWPVRREVFALFAVVALAAGGLAVSAASQPAHAATTAPTYEPDPNSAGAVTLYDANGAQILSGRSDVSPMAAYFAGSGGYVQGSPPGFTAQAYSATPVDGTNSQTWNADTLTAGTAFGTAVSSGYPGALKNSPNAIAKGSASDLTLEDIVVGEYPSKSAANPNTYQIRVYTGSTTSYYTADVRVDLAAHTWTQVYPAVATKTATSVGAITANPSSPAPHGATITLAAAVTAADGSHPAGTVHLFDGTTDKGAATLDAGTGKVTKTDTPADGAHSYTFAFTPSASTYSGSTSAALSYSVSAVTATTTTLAVTPAGGSTQGQSVTFTATVAPAAAAGTVTFKDGASTLGSPVAVSAGTASYSTTSLAVATHGLSAVFTPSNAAAYSGSTSATVSYAVSPKPATTTTTTLTPPASPVAYGAAVALSATVSPTSAVGSVEFLDGTTVLGTGTAAGSGKYTFSTSSLAAGSHSLTAKFVPTDATKFGSSTSKAATVVVSAQPTTTTLTAPASVDQNASTTLTAKLAPTTAAGTVTFSDGATKLGSAPVSSGVATLATSFATLGDHTLTASFVPTDSARFAGSTSGSVTVAVNKPAPGATTTAIAADPTSVVQGATVTVTATITPSSATGTVQFLEGTSALGSPVTVSGGKASYASKPATGSHTVHAVFTPDAAANLKASTSGEVTYTVKAPPTSTSTTLTVSPSGTVAYGTAVTFTATVAATTAQAAVTPAAGPAVAGTVTFENGATTLGSAAVTNGTAAFTTSTLPSGAFSVTATFTPTDPTAFAASTSSAVTGTVKAQPTTTSLGTSPSGTVASGATVTLTATLTPAAAAGSVTFQDGSTTLGKATVASGKATLTVSTLTVGNHTLTAVFTPTSATAFGASTSAGVSLEVVTAPAISGVTDGSRTLKAGDQVIQGDAVTVKGANFTPGETVSLLLGATVLTTAKVQTDGTVTATATVPTGVTGAVTFGLKGSLATPTFAVTVVARLAAGADPSAGSSGATAVGGSRGSLASTGADLAVPLTAGLLLLVLGGLAVMLGRRQRRARHAV